jgi:choline kinase
MMAAGQSFVCVNTSAVAEEEVKYTIAADGFIDALSKTVNPALGEAVGINYISESDRATFIRGLESCADGDYFERGLEIAIDRDGLKAMPLDITDLFAVEVDFEEDLSRANEYL